MINAEKIPVTITINGIPYSAVVPVTMRLSDFIREVANLTGTNVACGEGECGACTVHLDGKAVNSCIVLAADADGAKVTTIEGLIGPGGELHPVQQAFIDCGSIQCGFCTPGMIMQAVWFLDQNPNPTAEEVRIGLEGNLCRCTGYEKIVEAVLEAAGKLNTARSI
ncbi:MAG: (2Fe-2S)-binding protein [Planctomycetota bacterium]|jgi:carbon-monoxide dehydrogenase small subunit